MNTSQQIITEAVSRALPPQLKFSLVLATVGRTAELSNFLEHLDRQSYRNFELIVADQNPDDRLIPVLSAYDSRFTIKHLRCEKGLSRARNVGLHHISGDIVAFPDDDCWYQRQTLERVAATLTDHPERDGVTGKCNAPLACYYLDQNRGFLDKFNVWRRAISVSIFLRTSVVKSVGEFDELLGSGSASGFGAGEEMDYLLRAIERNWRLYYEPDLSIDHPDVYPIYDDQMITKGYSYARGVGYTLRKHRYPLWYVGYLLLRSLGGAVLSAAHSNRPKASYHWALVKGRLSGWIGKANTSLDGI